jgi:hypothetical protein
MEEEHRIIHVVNPPPQVKIANILDDKSTLSVEVLGLKLEKIHTSDVEQVRSIINSEYPQIRIPIGKFQK